MKGDYYCCLAEFATGETKSKAGEDACVAYAEATKIAEKDLAVTHPVRLVMALDSSVFQSEVLQNPDDGEVSMVQTVQKIKEIPQLHKVLDIHVVQVPLAQVVEKQSRSHSCRPLRKPLRLQRPRRFRALKPLRV